LIACHSHDNRSELLSKQVGKILLALNTDLIGDQLFIGLKAIDLVSKVSIKTFDQGKKVPPTN